MPSPMDPAGTRLTAARMETGAGSNQLASDSSATLCHAVVTPVHCLQKNASDE